MDTKSLTFAGVVGLFGLVVGSFLHLSGVASIFLLIVACLAGYLWYKVMGKRKPADQTAEQAAKIKRWMAAHPEEAAKLKGEAKSDKVA